MIRHTDIEKDALRKQLRQRKILLGGNRKLSIYGKLDCRSGKRMKRENRVFFQSVNEAMENGFRPCGHCLKAEYDIWKKGNGS
jgi:methylphosphotriester-DNA--protein-cysteine methyltransferase